LGPDDGEASGPSNLGDNMNPAGFFMLGAITMLTICMLAFGLFWNDDE
jgi:hypothetical protein